MNKDKINLEIKPSGNELIIREGSALPVSRRFPIKITGRLGVCADFLENKMDLYKPQTSHLQIHREKNKMTLYLNDKNPYSRDEIEGVLTEAPELGMWGINTSQRWKVAEFIRHIRQYRYRFADSSEQEKILSSLQKWNVTVEKIIKEHNDQSGNSLLMLETKVRDISLLNKFTVDLPIFYGYDLKRFTVEIGFDPKHTSVDLYLISDELSELTHTHKQELISTELERFKALEFDCSIVWIS